MTLPVTRESAMVRSTIYALSVLVVAAVSLVIYVLPKPEGGASPTALATVNALLNAGAMVCLVLGFFCVRAGDIRKHRAFMLAAFAFSSAFLVTYLLHHAQVGSVPFRGEGAVRIVYFAILIPHILLAAVVVPLALFTIYRGWTNRIELHRKVARFTLPIWLYVSLSGVLVYLMLYHL
jgi:putative membrane protein